MFSNNSNNSNKEIISLIDLTLLDEKGDQKAIEALCSKANALETHVAAICIYPKFILFAKKILNPDIAIATVVNFPKGDLSISEVVDQTVFALDQGADEIDLVIPYQNYQKVDVHSDDASIELVQTIKKICGDKILKVIIESGALSISGINQASKDAIDAGADFIKTSTGKIPTGARLDAAKIMFDAIDDARQKGVTCGFKASGGIRTKEDALSYLKLAEAKLGKAFINSKTFRFGASSLLDDLI